MLKKGKRKRLAKNRTDVDQTIETILPIKGIMTYNISTNGNELLVEFMLNQSARVGFMLFDTQGRLLTDFPKENLSKGLYHEKILLENSWPQSLVLRITVNEKIYGIKTVK